MIDEVVFAMINDITINLADVHIAAASGEEVTEILVSSELDNPIGILRTSRDKKGARFDILKAMLLRDGHPFDGRELRRISLIAQKRRIEMIKIAGL